MCGRFTLTLDAAQIERRFNASLPAGYKPRYNIAPTQEVLALLSEFQGRHLQALRWGLIPSWAQDPKLSFINARAETLWERPSFRHAVRQRRCLIIADGFYEWRQTPPKTPVYVRLKSREPFGFAGLWEAWNSPDGQTLKTCTIITTEPNELLQPIHPRMPVIVPREYEELWLDPSPKARSQLERVLRPYPAEELELVEVSPAVNSPSRDGPECIRPVKRS
ncbi:MAG: SOS response-associated peptidase [Candidatus Bipolaricaulota bacterium]|nr:SOS response-associated peptidase [Candidatus Bipolaricaulota bacterium]MCS7274029.1 SOS response-associated peptidase [Candidatus Bipolaricaulota bacterium]MDW8110229.1 SOS response-associated peptidase [Candidatus Bipolaricaulota bacterium]MDW8328871.1 SOS response-associated peptidase [Candidatus Bipolaricaulota bacterium]